MIAIKKPYDTHARDGISFSGKGRTKQSFRDECDINSVMRRWEKTGQLHPLQRYPPQYGDFTNVDDYQAAVNQVQQAEDAFMALPSRVRSRFGNDPAELLRFMADSANQAEAEKLGLVDPAPKPDPKAAPAAVIPAAPVPEVQPQPPIVGGE